MTHFVIVGLGSIGRRHAANLRALRPDATFTFVRHAGGVDDFCRAMEADVVSDVMSIIEKPVDLAVIATPSANHIDTLPALIERGWPLLVEKPIVTSVGDVDAIAKQLTSAPSALRTAGFNLRHLGSIRQLFDVVSSGVLGTVVRADFTAGQWLPDWRPDSDYRNSYSADADRGGGVELDLSHEFDLARWFFGELDVDFAVGRAFSDLELRSNDTSISVLSPAATPGPAVTVSLDYVSRRRVRRYEIVGDRGTATWNLDGSLELVDAASRRSVDVSPADFDVGQSYVTMTQHVLDAAAVQPGVSNRQVQSLADGLASSRLALAVRDRGGRS